MKRYALVAMLLASSSTAWAQNGQAPGPSTAPAIPIIHRDRVYAAEQFSNTV
ncbi:MAG: beta-propeller repeat protein, partial [Sphingomonas bacterium]|nr:beta-propeller repeat protein [Sphingomonas bacterium]